MELREQDFKYVMQDLSHVYIGCRFSFEQAGEAYDLPSKFKAAIYRIVIDEFPLEDMIGEHLIDLSKKSRTYIMYKQLEVKIKVCFATKKVDKKGNEREEYESKIYSIDEIIDDDRLKNPEEDYVIQEMSFSKRKLMALAV